MVNVTLFAPNVALFAPGRGPPHKTDVFHPIICLNSNLEEKVTIYATLSITRADPD